MFSGRWNLTRFSISMSRRRVNFQFWVNYSFNFWLSQKLSLEIYKCVFPATVTRWLWMIHRSPMKRRFQWKLWTACCCPVCRCKDRSAEGGTCRKGYWISCSFSERTVINMKSMNEPDCSCFTYQMLKIPLIRNKASFYAWIGRSFLLISQKVRLR